jgi:hypothetical protein
MIDSVSFFFTTKKQDAESMVNLFSLIKDYLVDQEAGIRQLIHGFWTLSWRRKPSSNLVPNGMSELIYEKPVETATNPELS